MLNVVSSLRQMSPWKYPDTAWLFVFLPAVVTYLLILTDYLNKKPHIGQIMRLDQRLDDILSINSKVEVIASGMGWAEGPLWVENEDKSFLLFSDTIHNKIWRWEEGKGLFTIGTILHIANSGCDQNTSWCESIYEPGSNGLLRLRGTEKVDIIAAQHGERAITILFHNNTRQVLANSYQGKRLNSPNDLIYSMEGNIYFTDPIYGLFDTSRRSLLDAQLPHSGVYMLRKKDIAAALASGRPARVLLLDANLTRPNGIGLSPDHSKLYVSNSDATLPVWNEYAILEDGSLSEPKVFYDASELRSRADFGNPDGFTVDAAGNILASGPGGVLIFAPDATLLGRIIMDRPVSNVAFGTNGYLYLTAKDVVCRVRVKTRPIPVISL